eukprot:m.135229 g.135229  ORF g.135229 m.135229 type:complete len:517 (-) comp29783_c1_seq4:156-1706(-)
MADVRQNDGNLAWLKKRLRGQWSAAGMGSALTQDTLESVTQSFHLLDSQIRVRMLLSILSLRPKELVTLKPQLAALLEIAKLDVDEWVKSVYCLVRQYVDTSSLHELVEQGSDLSQKQVAAFNTAMTTIQDADWNNANPYYPLETGLLNPSISGLGDHTKPQHKHNHFVLKKMPARAVTSTQRDEDKIAVGGGGGGSRSWVGGKSSNLKSTNTTGASSRSVGAGFGLGRATVRRSQLLPPDRRPSQPISPNPISTTGSRRDFLKNMSHTKSTKRDGVQLLDTDDLPPMLQARKRSRIDVAATDKSGKQAVPPPPATSQVPPQAPFSGLADGYSHMGATPDISTPVESGMPASYGLTPTPALYGAQPIPTTGTAPTEYSNADAVKVQTTDSDAKPVGSPIKKVDPVPQKAVVPSPQKQPVAPPAPVVSEQTLNDIFSQSNRLSKEDRDIIERFLQRKPVPTGGKDVAQIVLHEERSPGPTPQSVIIEQFVFEMTFATKDWRRLKRKRKVNMKAPQAS